MQPKDSCIPAERGTERSAPCRPEGEVIRTVAVYLKTQYKLTDRSISKRETHNRASVGGGECAELSVRAPLTLIVRG